MTRDSLPALSSADLDAQSARLLPDKELVSLLDLNVDLDLAIDLSAPIDLAVAANANVAAPIDAAVSANLLTIGSSAAAQATQDALVVQELDADAIATAPQTAVIDQSNDVIGSGAAEAAPAGGAADVAAPAGGAEDATSAAEAGAAASPTDVAPAADVVDGASGLTDAVGNEVTGVTSGGLLDGNLLNVDVNVALDADVAAPIAGAVAANANVAAPIDAAAAANVGTIDSEAVAIADQTAIIQQTLTGTAEATADQDATITQ
jgi:hypothetical protein